MSARDPNTEVYNMGADGAAGQTAVTGRGRPPANDGGLGWRPRP